MGLRDNWFRKHNPADIKAKVDEITLAEISKWTSEELDRVGWTNNAIIDIMFGLTANGIWSADNPSTTTSKGYYDSYRINAINTDIAALEVLVTALDSTLTDVDTDLAALLVILQDIHDDANNYIRVHETA